MLNAWTVYTSYDFRYRFARLYIRSIFFYFYTYFNAIRSLLAHSSIILNGLREPFAHFNEITSFFAHSSTLSLNVSRLLQRDRFTFGAFFYAFLYILAHFSVHSYTFSLIFLCVPSVYVLSYFNAIRLLLAHFSTRSVLSFRSFRYFFFQHCSRDFLPLYNASTSGVRHDTQRRHIRHQSQTPFTFRAF